MGYSYSYPWEYDYKYSIGTTGAVEVQSPPIKLASLLTGLAMCCYRPCCANYRSSPASSSPPPHTANCSKAEQGGSLSCLLAGVVGLEGSEEEPAMLFPWSVQWGHWLHKMYNDQLLDWPVTGEKTRFPQHLWCQYAYPYSPVWRLQWRHLPIMVMLEPICL